MHFFKWNVLYIIQYSYSAYNCESFYYRFDTSKSYSFLNNLTFMEKIAISSVTLALRISEEFAGKLLIFGINNDQT